ncbi:MAG: acVLRF1 family peptidyl-tRNA hydrolase [Nocardioides sp.]
MRTVPVPPERLVRWCDNFAARHGATAFAVVDGRLLLTADDGESASVALPWERSYDGQPDPGLVAAAASEPLLWGVLLVRKGGFAVALLDGEQVLASKVGQRHVQGRTKAGGQSQQRFARRRDNQARQAYEAAADHAHRILVGEAARPPEVLVCGGDHAAVDAVLADPRFERLPAHHAADHRSDRLADRVVDPWLPVPDPRRSVLEDAVATAGSLQITLSPG